jgi:hypothetical protein
MSIHARLDSLLEETYLNDVVGEVCGDNVSRHFPNVSGFEAASKLWDVPPTF